MNTRSSKLWGRGAVVALAVPSILMGAALPAMSSGTAAAGAYSDSYGLLVDLKALAGNVPVNLGPEAPVSSSYPSGGTHSATFLSAGLGPSTAQVDILKDSATTASAPTATAQSRTANVDALGAVAQITIHADAITATSTTSCTAAPKGSTEILNLSIGGTKVPVPNPLPPNTTVVDPVLNALGLRIILNEEHPAAQGRGLVVNGLHVIAAGTGALPVGGTIIRGDVIVAHATSGVVCPGGPGSDNGGLPKPDISFFKSASPSVAHAGDTVTYSAVVTNQSSSPCEVLKLVDHIAPAFSLVSSAGPLGTKLDTPPPARTDGGVDAVLRPTGVTIGAGKSVTQTFTVTVKDGATPGTYYDTLELYCGVNGDFVSGPLAPVTVAGPGATPPAPVSTEKPPAGPVFAPTGLNSTIPAVALLLLIVAAGARRFQLSRR